MVKSGSVDLVKAYLAQIEKHDKRGAHLNAIINVVSKDQLLETARQLDRNRPDIDAKSNPLYGIPFLVKVTLALPLLHVKEMTM
jgi:amidase